MKSSVKKNQRKFKSNTPEDYQTKADDYSTSTIQLNSYQDFANQNSAVVQLAQFQNRANNLPLMDSFLPHVESNPFESTVIQREGSGDSLQSPSAEIPQDTTVDVPDLPPPPEPQAFSDERIEETVRSDQSNEGASARKHVKELVLAGMQFKNMADDAKTGSEGLIATGGKFADSAVRENSFINGLMTSLEGLKAVPILSTILNIYTFGTLYVEFNKKKKAKQAFLKLKKADAKKGKTTKESSVGNYAFAKVKRGFIDTCMMIGVELLETVGNIVGILTAVVSGVGVLIAGIVKTVTAAIKLFRSAIHVIKGFIKWVSGKRGKNRAKNATKLMRDARKGDKPSAQAICDLRTNTLKSFNDNVHPETAEEVIYLLNLINRRQIEYNKFSKRRGLIDDDNATIDKSILKNLTKEISKLMRSKSDA